MKMGKEEEVSELYDVRMHALLPSDTNDKSFATVYSSFMSQQDAWEREYQRPRLVAFGDEPQADVKKFFAYLRRKQGVELTGLHVLDVGCGTGKNSKHLAELGNDVLGIDISFTALKEAEKRAQEISSKVKYVQADMGKEIPAEDATFDLALDVMSSNSLLKTELLNYVSELHRVLKAKGFVFVRTLRKEGDKHARNLLASHPGPEVDTYVHPGLGLVERVFGEQDLRELYGTHFSVLSLEPKTNYSRFDGKVFKRNYWLCVLRKF